MQALLQPLGPPRSCSLSDRRQWHSTAAAVCCSGALPPTLNPCQCRSVRRASGLQHSVQSVASIAENGTSSSSSSSSSSNGSAAVVALQEGLASGASREQEDTAEPPPAQISGSSRSCVSNGAINSEGVAVAASAAAESQSEHKARLWKAAIKLPMYSVGYVPVLVAAAAVYYTLDVAPIAQVFGFALAAVLIIAWLNLSNDAFDAQTGVDVSKPESLVNLTGRPRLVAGLAVASFAAGTGLLAWLLSNAGDARPAGLLAFSIACGYIYQGPPFRLSYKGLGEPLCFAAFGPSATTAFFLALAGPHLPGPLPTIPPLVWLLGVLVGLTTTLILLTSHFHQVEGDRAAGKMSPLVRIGIHAGLRLLQVGVVGAYALLAAGAATGLLPLPAAAMATIASLPAAHELLGFAARHYTVPRLIAPLKRFACMWHIALGLGLATGLAAARYVSGSM